MIMQRRKPPGLRMMGRQNLIKCSKFPRLGPRPRRMSPVILSCGSMSIASQGALTSSVVSLITLPYG